MRKLLKLLFRPKSLARSTASGIARAVNSSDDAIKAKVAQIATVSNELASVAETLSAMLKDGTIDAVEESTLATILEPYYTQAKELI